jgi:hypothetical protein
MSLWYRFGMKKNTKSSVTLPPAELKLVLDLRKRLKAKSNVEVIRRSLFLLKTSTDNSALKSGYALASAAVRGGYLEELADLEGTIGDGLE